MIRTHDPVAIHPTVRADEGVVVWQYATICEGVQLGHGVVVGSSVYIGRHTAIGDGTRIQDGAHLTDNMQVGQRVFIGPHAVTMNDKNPRVGNPNYTVDPPIIEDDVTIGANATILPGVRLGKGCVVGAGSVVIKDVEPHTTVFGNPARVLKTQPVATEVLV